ncbi:hypothetical protein [Microbispora sp. CA-102843]|uniref:hypothetical protein n=1 Tax=Microbispora sp. CA-102843 TaxID=3239952 RepID=UPI003D90169B
MLWFAWRAHHTLFDQIERVSRPMLVPRIPLLFFVASVHDIDLRRGRRRPSAGRGGRQGSGDPARRHRHGPVAQEAVKPRNTSAISSTSVSFPDATAITRS